jgi:LacI family transcriptional regulator
MATIVDVARKANVSPMTVSRVINGTGRVKEETRRRVLKAMEELHYYPNQNARGLVKKQTQMIWLLITDITNPFFTTLARGAEDTANLLGFRMLFGNSDENIAKEKDYVEMMLSSRVDGVLFTPSGDESHKHLHLLNKYKIPFVVIDREVPGIASDKVIGDNLLGTRLLMRHLFELGHTRIACFCGPRDIFTARQRLAVYLEELKLQGIPEDPSLIIETNYKADGGRKAVEQLLKLPEPPTAIFAANNLIALGAIQSLQAHGWRVPEEISVVSFDDLGVGTDLDPFLTVVTQPAYDFGAIGMRLLCDRIRGTAPADWRQIVLPPQLIVRKSSCPPRHFR